MPIARKADARHAERAASLGELLGVEGSAAARHFANFASLLKADELGAFLFSERNRRPPRDPVNALLSFGYSMLVGEGLQLSVFQCRLDAQRRVTLEAALREVIHAEEDHVLIIDVGPADQVAPKFRGLGKSFDPRQRGPIIA